MLVREFMKSRRRTLVAVLLACCSGASAQAAPDEELLGKDQGYPVGTRTTWFYNERVRVGSFSHLDSILPHHRLPRADQPRQLPIAATPPAFTYQGWRWSSRRCSAIRPASAMATARSAMRCGGASSNTMATG